MYLFKDGLSVFKSHMEENRESGEGKTERKGHSGVTRGGVSCREIAQYCFCDRGNVNWPCGCVTSRRGRRGTKWTQNTPWERFSIPDVAKTGMRTQPPMIVCGYARVSARI